MSVYDPKCCGAVTQDGGLSKQGTIQDKKNTDGWICVKWDNGHVDGYRMGCENCYDLQLSTGNFYDV